MTPPERRETPAERTLAGMAPGRRSFELERGWETLEHAAGTDMSAHVKPHQCVLLLGERDVLARLRGADPVAVAEMFHDAYERLAPDFGYETREASAKPWNEVPEQNRELMVATVKSVLDGLLERTYTQPLWKDRRVPRHDPQ